MEFVGISQIKPKKEKNEKYISIKLSKEYVVAESKNAVLFSVEQEDFESFKFWINKWAIWTSQYSNILEVSILNDDEFKYSIYRETNNDWKKPDLKISGSELNNELLKIYDIKYLNNMV